MHFSQRILFYNKFAIKETNFETSHTRNYQFTIVQICEVIYLLNDCMHFYFYCLTGSRFLKQLNYSSKSLHSFKDTLLFIQFYLSCLNILFAEYFGFKTNETKVKFYIEKNFSRKRTTSV